MFEKAVMSNFSVDELLTYIYNEDLINNLAEKTKESVTPLVVLTELKNRGIIKDKRDSPVVQIDLRE